MVFKCQQDSFLKEVFLLMRSHSCIRHLSSLLQFASKVVLCEKAELKRKNAENKDECLSGYNVVLDDTILFPEGGGQVSFNTQSAARSLFNIHKFTAL